MTTMNKKIEWLRHCTEEYCSGQNDIGGLVEDLENEGKLGHGFSSVDHLDEVGIGDGMIHRSTYISSKLSEEQKEQVCIIIQEFVDCFAWEYTEILGLSRDLVKHRLTIKPGFRPYKQPPRSFNPILHGRIKEEIDRLLKAKFIQPCSYVEWVCNIVHVEKKNTDKIQVCVDFRNMNRVTPKDEYHMPIAENLINRASSNKIIRFLDGNAGYNQIFMAREDIDKTAFRCPGFVGLFEWVVMTFGLKMQVQLINKQ
jgi:hypothetical protein